MLSEGVQSLVDTGNEVLLLYGMHRTKRPPDANAERFVCGAAIFGVLTNDADIFAIDRDLVLSTYLRASAATNPTEPLSLSPDGRGLLMQRLLFR